MNLLNGFYLLIGGYENNQRIYIIDVIKYQLIKQCL